MESVYFYKSNMENNIKDILSDDEFMRLSYTTKSVFYDDKAGFYIYIIGSEVEIESLDVKFNLIGAEKLKIFERDVVISNFKQDADNAASGMGLIFG
jgi:hypothetical protein